MLKMLMSFLKYQTDWSSHRYLKYTDGSVHVAGFSSMSISLSPFLRSKNCNWLLLLQEDVCNWFCTISGHLHICQEPVKNMLSFYHPYVPNDDLLAHPPGQSMFGLFFTSNFTAKTLLLRAGHARKYGFEFFMSLVSSYTLNFFHPSLVANLEPSSL